jgi:hypothetical protein
LFRIIVHAANSNCCQSKSLTKGQRRRPGSGVPKFPGFDYGEKRHWI